MKVQATSKANFNSIFVKALGIFRIFKNYTNYPIFRQTRGPVKPVYKSPSKFDNEDEPLLRENPRRFVLLPIQYKDIWEMYKKAEGKEIKSYPWKLLSLYE